MSKSYSTKAPRSGLFSLSLASTVGGPLLLILLFCAACADVSFHTSIAMMVVTGVVLIYKLVRQDPSNLTTANSAAVLYYMIIFGATSFIAVATKFAMSEYTKLLIGFCLFLLTMLLASRKNLSAAITSVCFSMSTTGAFLGAISVGFSFNTIFGYLIQPVTQYFMLAPATASTTRIQSALSNPNCYAGIMALAIVATLVLLLNSETLRDRCVALSLFTFNCIAFLLAFSMGGSASIAVGFIVMLIVIPAEKRGQLFAYFLLTLALTMTGVSVVFALLSAGGTILPLLVAILFALAAPLLYERVVSPIMIRLQSHQRLIVIVFAALVAGVIAFAVLCLTLTGAYTLDASQTLYRSSYPDVGSYTLSVESADEVNVTITVYGDWAPFGQSAIVLYEGSADGATFEVPEGEMVTYFLFSSDTDTTIQSATWTGESGSGSVPLNYLLLPDFISSRLQGLLANDSFIQRMLYITDGLSLFALSPLYGRGLGTFENSLFSVQSFYYETKYTHNQLIQSLCDSGILGALGYLSLIATAGYSLVRARRRQEVSVTASILLGGLAFFVVNTLSELNFSDQHYLIFAFLFLALVALLSLSNEAKKPPKKHHGTAVAALALGICVVFGGFWGAAVTVEQLVLYQGETVYDGLERYARTDFFNRNDAKMTYLKQAISDTDISDADLATADQYAQELSTAESNAIGVALIQYYLFREDPESAFDAAFFTASFMKSKEATWNSIFSYLSEGTSPALYIEYADLYNENVAALYDYFLEVQSQQLDDLQLDETSMTFINSIAELAATPDATIDDAVRVLIFGM